MAIPALSMSDDKNYSDVVIIGGVAAGPKTAATLARRNGGLSITLYQKEDMLSYGSCGLPYFASGDIESLVKLTSTSYDVVRSPEFFRNSKGFAAVTGHEVTAIDRPKKTVTVKNLQSGESREHGYGTLVIATGATPTPAPFPVADSPRICPFTRPHDAVAFRKLAQTGQIGKAIIIGGGFIGCELTEATASLWGIETILIERENQILPYVLDADMAGIAQREMSRQDIKVRTGATVEKIDLDDDENPVVHLAGGKAITADYVFMCLGVRPEVRLAREAGLEIGPTGAITVNDRMQTSDADIYAGGDCVETTHQLTGKPLHIPMGSLANRHGRIIAENIAGRGERFPGALGAFLLKLFDINIGAVGLSMQAAERAGISARAVWGTFTDKADYYPESNTVCLKMTYEPETSRVLGLQAVGAGDICRRVDSLSALLQARATLDDILAFEHGYAPPYSEALDPLHHLAAMAQSAGRGISFLSPDVQPTTDVAAVWLDVREPGEIESEPWLMPEGATLITIPLDSLRDRLDEVPRDATVNLVCKRGPRSYQAAVILTQAGFDDVHILSGGYQAARL